MEPAESPRCIEGAFGRGVELLPISPAWPSGTEFLPLGGFPLLFFKESLKVKKSFSNECDAFGLFPTHKPKAYPPHH